MAIRYRKDRRRWQVYWHNPFTGKQESVLFENREEAKRKNDEIRYNLKWNRDAFREVKPKPKKAKAQKKPDDTLGAIDFAYLKTRRWPRERVLWHAKCMKYAMKALGRKPISEITTRDLSEVMGTIMVRPVSTTTVRAFMGRLLTVLRWAYDQGYVDALPRFPKLPPAQSRKFTPPTPEELDRIIAAAKPHVQRVIVLGARLGLRVGPSELLKLTWDNVDLANAVVHVPAARKNPKEPWRDVPIMDSLLPVFREWREEDRREGVKHVVHWKGKPVGNIRRAFIAAVRRAGITRYIRPYDLRHAFATDALAAGQDIGTVSRIMGHANPAMTLRVYQHVRVEQKREAVNALPEVHGLAKRCPKMMPKATVEILQ